MKIKIDSFAEKERIPEKEIYLLTDFFISE